MQVEHIFLLKLRGSTFVFDFGLKIHVIYSSQDKTTLAKSWIDSKNDNCLEGFQYFDNFFLNRLHRVMVVSTRLEATKTEIIDVIKGEPCSNLPDFKAIIGPVYQGMDVSIDGRRTLFHFFYIWNQYQKNVLTSLEHL